MKRLIFISLITLSCTQKYTDYDLIRKTDFDPQNFSRPILVQKFLKSHNDQISQCFNQWLFFSNAEKLKETQLTSIIRSLCPNSGDILIDLKVVERWWTILIFSQACVNIKAYCTQKQN